MNFNTLFGLGLILVDIIVRMAAYRMEMDYVPDFGFLYVGLLNVIAGLILRGTPSLIFRIIVSSMMFLTVLYPVSRFMEHMYFMPSLSQLLGYLGLWFGATGIIFLLFTPVE